MLWTDSDETYVPNDSSDVDDMLGTDSGFVDILWDELR